MAELEKKIDYYFKNKSILKKALTHSSAAHEQKNPGNSNERLEFLGDSVLSIVVSDYLYRNYKHLPEGELTKIRASLVCEKSLYSFAKQLDLGKYLILGKGEENNGGRTRSSILADAFEALIAAIYLDGGLEKTSKFVLSFVSLEIESQKNPFIDYKTTLQEIIQKNPEERLAYELISMDGPDHNKSFVVEVHLNSNVIGKGKGSSKKEAEQAAACEALELMGYRL